MAPWTWRRRGGRKPRALHIATLTTILALVWGGAFAATAAQAVSGPPANITMSTLTPQVITADGAARATAVVHLSDILGNPVDGDQANLLLSSSDPAMTFDPVVPDGNGDYTVSVVSSTHVHQVLITVTETASGISASQPLTQVAGPAHDVVLTLASGVLVANGLSSTTATIAVSDAHGNPIAGDALVLSSSDPGVQFGSVSDLGNGTYSATVFGSNQPGSDTIRATDISANPAPVGTATLTETPAPSLVNIVSMQWTFFYTPAYSVARSLVVDGAPAAASIKLACQGRGCPFAAMKLKLSQQPKCTRRSHRVCWSGPTLVLTPRLARHRLHLGARLTVAIVRPGWIGKYYGFRIMSAAGPTVRIKCLAPGGSQPGVGC